MASLCDPHRVSLDIGADVGEFAIAMLPSSLSDQSGVTAMRIVQADPGRSTIDRENVLDTVGGGRVATIDVPVKRLDDLHLNHVGLVKIDVEGHELAVLRGAMDTLRRNRPTIVLEAEERHHANAVADITALLSELGFRGYFNLDGERRPVEEFDAGAHQHPANIVGAEDDWAPHGVYVNNFVFEPT